MKKEDITPTLESKLFTSKGQKNDKRVNKVYDAMIKQYDSKFNQLFDPRLKLIKTNTLRDVKADTFRKSFTNLPLEHMLSSGRSTPTGIPETELISLPRLQSNSVPAMPIKETSVERKTDPDTVYRTHE